MIILVHTLNLMVLNQISLKNFTLEFKALLELYIYIETDET